MIIKQTTSRSHQQVKEEIRNGNKMMSDFDTLQAMLRQERTYYRTDFRPVSPVDTDSRSKIRDWFESICTFCQYKDEVLLVEIAMNCLDRFVLTSEGSYCCSDQCEYQLAAVSCLYMAVKVHAGEALSSQNMATISRGTYTVEQIEGMERRILSALHWRINPPTTLCFVREYVNILLAGLQLLDQDQVRLEGALTLIQKQIQAASNDCSLMGLSSSTIALAALMKAIFTLHFGKKDLSLPLSIIHKLVAQSSPNELLTTAQDRLYPSRLMDSPVCLKPTEMQRCQGETSPRSCASIATSSAVLLTNQ
jgi:Cyclin, N-terminal domain